jgi:hypothetical protein
VDPGYSLDSSEAGGLLTVRFSGRCSPANAREMTQRYLELVVQAGQRKVLADIRDLRGRLSAAATFLLVHDLPVQPVPSGIRTAILDSGENRNYGRFLEDITVNLGMNVRCFTDAPAAQDWLASPG